jgi:hypothetical protein
MFFGGGTWVIGRDEFQLWRGRLGFYAFACARVHACNAVGIRLRIE